MRFTLLALLALPVALPAQTGHFPPDSLINIQVIAKGTPVSEVIGQMRNFAGALGVRCQFCHVGEEGMRLDRFDFAKDEKRTKLVARQMMRMVEEINRRIDTLPGRASGDLTVTCRTCHHGVSRPVPLATLLVEAAQTAGADSAVRAYRTLRERYYGRDAYDFGEVSLNTAAFRLGRDGRFPEAFALLDLNQTFFPASAGPSIFRGNLQLMKGDTVAAEAAFTDALRRDSTNAEARGRLNAIRRGRQ
ncbi:MAG TPA: c-type cytochrome [Gemmatimonadales bacterium]|nr:c-type cytochrome [Gemmatimonadales bacterium]